MRSEYDYNEWWLFQQPEKEAKTIIEVLLEHNRMKNWKKLRGKDQIKKLSNQRLSEKKATWFHEIENIILADTHTRKMIVDESKKNQPTIGRVATKRACFTNIVCYESNSKGKSRAGEKSSKRVLQEKSSNEVKRTRTEELIDILP
ncbi:36060_t:CDS:2 [Gigaspora margarita]|uniref:36060_t:CDS:1 n=1 Tax=Gigaspora margarita TaxID=4874 RepID=A0ABN7VAK0_GIGMA|nr:36060_t:CDS:2 [Gigaspora margarita]